VSFETFLPLIIILVLVALNGVFVAAEFALVGARRQRLLTMAENGNRAATWLLALFDKPTGKDSYIAIAQLGITLASIGLGMYGEPAIAVWLYGPFESAGLSEHWAHVAGFAIALSIITFMHVVFGEMIPKALALQAPEQVSTSVNAFMRLFGLLFKPMVAMLNWMALGLMRMLGIRDPGKSSLLYTSKELAIVTEEVAQSGQLDSVQRTLINNIFGMEDRTVEQLMTTRSRMHALDAEMSAAEVADRIAGNAISRYPVYRGNMDNILGVLHVKDFIRAYARDGAMNLAGMVRELPSVSAGTTAEELLSIFKAKRMHAAIVVDEFGGTIGFVTMDDLIADVIEEEDAPTEGWIVVNEDGSYTLDGEVTLAELAENHEIPLAHADAVTIAGLFLAQHGTLPVAGTTVNIGGYVLTAESLHGLKITKVRLSR
jgi:CBS domain containing-hemolysin-like protein